MRGLPSHLLHMITESLQAKICNTDIFLTYFSFNYIMDKQTIRLIRKIYISCCITTGIISPIFCYFLLPEFNIIEHPLSYFGVVKKTNLFWQISLILISIGLYLNGSKRIDELIRIKKYHLPIRSMLFVSCSCLLLTAIFTLKYNYWHHVFAISFFLVYNFFVFIFGLARSLTYVRRGLFSVTIGCLMLLSSLLLLPFPSYGITEVIFISLVIIWNVTLFVKSLKLI